jgi:hypothetical protein
VNISRRRSSITCAITSLCVAVPPGSYPGIPAAVCIALMSWRAVARSFSRADASATISRASLNEAMTTGKARVVCLLVGK